MKTFLLLLFVSLSETTFAQSSARFTITRDVSAGGGATVTSSARFSLASTIAQPLAAVPSSARFSIQGGFWIRPAPIFFAPTSSGTNFTISIQSELGETYTVQYLNSLTGSSWQNLTNFTGNGAVMTVTNSALGIPNRFYRLMQQ
ncbi:MAG TPA: hypothetical protein VGI03_10720 [Verrucomicrobiae bacterium]|jgi:hypothetical protein